MMRRCLFVTVCVLLGLLTGGISVSTQSPQSPVFSPIAQTDVTVYGYAVEKFDYVRGAYQGWRVWVPPSESDSSSLARMYVVCTENLLELGCWWPGTPQGYVDSDITTGDLVEAYGRSCPSWPGVFGIALCGSTSYHLVRVQEDTPPIIGAVQASESAIFRRGAGVPDTLSISAEVTDASSLQWVRVNYRLRGDGWSHEDMRHVSGARYLATIGPFDRGGILDWYVSAADGHGNENRSEDSSVAVKDPGHGRIEPVYPDKHSVPSVVMRGGTLFRHFSLVDESGSGIPGATVSFSDGDMVTSDSAGAFTYTLAVPTGWAAGTSETIRIENATLAGGQCDVEQYPQFEIQVTSREYGYSWSYGINRQANVGMGLYAIGVVDGGLDLSLLETDPDATGDDRVGMSQVYALGGGLGAGAGLGHLNLGEVAKIEAEASLEAVLRLFGALRAQFDDPYSDPDQCKAQGVFLLISAVDTATGVPSLPFLVSLVEAATPGHPYLQYIKAQETGLGVQVTGEAGCGIWVGLGARLDSSDWKAKLLALNLAEAKAGVNSAVVLTDYGDEYGIGLEAGLEFDVDGLIPGVTERWLPDLVGGRASSAYLEFVFRRSANEPEPHEDRFERLEITIRSERSRAGQVPARDVERVATRFVLPAAGISRPGAFDVGELALTGTLATLLDCGRPFTYTVEVEDGISVKVEPTLGIPGVAEIEIALQVERARTIVRERGMIVGCKRLVLESYAADDLVARPGKEWTDLVENALGGLWEQVRDLFNYAKERITSGLGWILEVVAKSLDGGVQGIATLSVSDGAQLARSSASGPIPLAAGTAVTVTAVGWVPGTVNDGTAAGACSAALGSRFVIGGVYEFQPSRMSVYPAATLSVTYTDAAARGLPENDIGLFRWDPATWNWHKVDARQDMRANSFTTSIDELGTFTLGYDKSPPQITIQEPAEDAKTSSPLRVVAIISDAGVGVDSTKVWMELDGALTATSYYTFTGELVATPALGLGLHRMVVHAADSLGQVQTANSQFEVVSLLSTQVFLYMPVLTRSHPTSE